jgi:hypothetical protein
MREVTKANKLPVNDYVEMLDVAKHLRSVITSEIGKIYLHRVYTEARKGGLRSKMILCRNRFNYNHLQELANISYPHLDIQIKRHNYSEVCIFIKTK